MTAYDMRIRYWISDVCSSDLLVVTKANRHSTVHRPVHLDVIGIKIFDAEGVVAGERLFVGLFTSMAYNVTPRRIPFLRRKVQAVMDRSGFDPKRSEEHTSELQSLMRISYAVFCLKKKKQY